ncbi:hypothetical protein [Flavobacterium sp. HNIBRBA15423]|uniref:hypothetical protein n=1 Tax=Flavobacterium sp. HNIBRBA15423 TaxID=3458683 RepID=UPI0040439F03
MNKIIESLSLEDITIFLQNGSLDNAPEGIAEYVTLLDKTRGMLLRFDKYPNDDIIANSLVITEKISKVKARKIINESREFFYADVQVSKEAWRNILAEKMLKVINLSMLSIKDVSDGDKVTKMIERLSHLRNLDKVDAEELPEELFQQQFVVYTTDAEQLGLPKANRNAIKEFIDKKVPDLTEKEKQRLYQEADVIPFKAFQNDQENPRKT